MSAVDKEVSANKHQKKATLLLAQAQLKAQDLVSDAEQEAENKKLYILQAARQEIINLSAQNEQVLKQQKLSMKNDIEKAIVENAFLIANKILEHEIDDKQHQDIIDKFIRNLK